MPTALKSLYLGSDIDHHSLFVAISIIVIFITLPLAASDSRVYETPAGHLHAHIDPGIGTLTANHR